MRRYSHNLSHKRPRRSIKPFFIAFAFAAFLLFGAAVYGLAQLKINSIEIIGVQFIDPEAVREIVREESAKGLLKSNILILPKKRIEEAVKESFVIESLDFNRRWPGTLRLTVRELLPAAFWATSGQSYEPIEESEGEIRAASGQIADLSKLFFIDKRGIILHEWQKPVIEEAEEEAADWPLLEQPKLLADKIHRNLPLIVDTEGREARAGIQVLADYGLSDIEKFNKSFPKEQFSFEVKYFSFPSPLAPKEIRAMTDKNFWIILNRDTDWDQIAKNLKEAITKKKITDLDKLSYIDLRLSDRMFFK
ncbi:FtsQ-type POTRA domain-containing protein [Patescibacteria group bacterium]|nr:MAG: FtsQ-type POTRA domain-containing protein [Patescibacteria group bacterium]